METLKGGDEILKVKANHWVTIFSAVFSCVATLYKE